MKIMLDRFNQSFSYFHKYYSDMGHEIPFVSVLEDVIVNRDKFGSTHFVSDFDIIALAHIAFETWDLSSTDLDIASQYEGQFITLCSRYATTPANWSPQEISETYFMLINYWVKILKTEKIDAIFSLYIPHDPSSYALYVTAKILKVPHIFVDNVTIGGKIKYFGCSLQHRDILITNDYASINTQQVLEFYVENIRNNFSKASPPFMKNVNSESQIGKFSSILRDLTNIAYAFVRDVMRPKTKKPAVGFFKKRRGSWGDSGIHFSSLIEFYFFLMLKNFKLRKSKSRYGKLCSNVLPDKYVYFPAPLEPEATNQPLARSFKHIRIIVGILSTCIDSDWKIVFKVNPGQFQGATRPNSALIDWHYDGFYKMLMDYNNVIFVDPEKFDTMELIDNSMCVAAINGTVGIEAIFRNKHCLTFAPMWYNQMHGIHQCSTREDVLNALRECKTNNPAPDLALLKISDDASFQITSFVQNSFLDEDYQKIAEKFLSSLAIFDQVSEKKWMI